MNAPAIDVALYQRKLDEIGMIPRIDTLTGLVGSWVASKPGWTIARNDDQLAPLMAMKLIHQYTSIYEHKYPEFQAANGEVLPIDSSVPHTAASYKWYSIDFTGYAAWIDDDGTIMPTSELKASEHIGYIARAGHKFSFTTMDLERAAAANVPIPAMKQRNAKRAHDAKRNWTWLFGDSSKKLVGLCNHPNIQIEQAPDGAAGTHGDARDSLVENKTNEEILADIETVVETIPRSTLNIHFVAKVYMPRRDIQTLKRRRLGAGDGTLSLWDYIQSNYGTGDGNQPAVQFLELNECDPAFRLHPEYGTDTSSIYGRFWIAIPRASSEELAFIMAKPFSQEAPQQVDLKITTITTESYGGCKCQIPTAVLRFDFNAVDNATAP